MELVKIKIIWLNFSHVMSSPINIFWTQVECFTTEEYFKSLLVRNSTAVLRKNEH